jgi:hypothetical protein
MASAPLRDIAAAALLRAQHGEAEARKIALTEQRRAKRARSKKRFAFWAEVAAQIENVSLYNAANTQLVDRVGAASRMSLFSMVGGMSLRGGQRA